jgi:hypothetical protein
MTEVRHVGVISGCRCACGGYLLVTNGYVNGTPLAGIARVVTRHQQTREHRNWAARTHPSPAIVGHNEDAPDLPSAAPERLD